MGGSKSKKCSRDRRPGGEASGSLSASRPSGSVGHGDNRPISTDRIVPEDYRKILHPKKTEKRMEFNSDIPKTLTPRGYEKYISTMDETNKKSQNSISKSNELWEDKDFPAEDKSIGISRLENRVEWKRPKEIDPKAEYFVDGVCRFDVNQGELGDCWILSVLSVVADCPCLYNQILPKDQSIESSNGMFRVKLWDGKWIEVLVDDRLPVYKGTNDLLFMRSSAANEFWPCLIEKALAKFFGSYENLSGGTNEESMVFLTAGVCQSFDLSGCTDSTKLFDIMMRSSKNCCLMASAIHFIDPRSAQGLVGGHAYGVTKVEKVTCRKNQQMLIRVRNPWGNAHEWRGPWSDNSPEWKNVGKKEKKRIGYKKCPDGEFWMSFEDFVSMFSTLTIGFLGLDSLGEGDQVRGKFRLKTTIYTGDWKEKISDGGSAANITTFWKNPQYQITFDDPDPDDDDNLCTVFVGLTQKNMRREGRYNLRIGFVIYQSDVAQTRKMSSDQLMSKKPCVETGFHNRFEVSSHSRLEPGSYVIIPSTYEPNQEGGFILRVLTKTVVEEAKRKDLVLHASEYLAKRFKEIQNPRTEAINVIDLETLLNKFNPTNLQNFEGFDCELCHSLAASFDINQNGSLELDEFGELWKHVTLLMEVFFKHDKKMTGHFNNNEFCDVLKEIGYTVSNNVFSNLVHRYQNPGTSNISFRDFMLCAVRLRTAFETARAHPKDNKGNLVFDKEDVSIDD